MLGDKITALDNRQYFCTLEHRDRVFAVINQLIKDRKISSLFMKTAIACLAPYASKGIINYGEADPLAVQRILAPFDINQIENLAHTDQLINLMLDYFDDKIMDPEKFKMVFCCMILTFKGLRISEIMSIVSSKILRLLNFQCEISLEQWKLLITFTKTFFFSFKGSWKVGNEILSRTIQNKYNFDQNYSECLLIQ